MQDKKALTTEKVGDKVDITWTEALIVSLDEGQWLGVTRAAGRETTPRVDQ